MFEGIIETYSYITSNPWILTGVLGVFAWLLGWMIFILYMDHINLRWYMKQEWDFLHVTVPPENEKSPLTFEHVFNQLHAIKSTITFGEKYIEGKFQIWCVWEIVSIGGVIGYYVRILKKQRDTLEAAVYSQYPDAEITEVEDYMLRLPQYDPETSEYDIFAFDFKLKNKDPYPIRTYTDFEHSSLETFVDPITGMWEELGKISPYEMVIIQYIFQPAADDAWKGEALKIASELKGDEPEGGGAIFDTVFEALRSLIDPLFDAILRPGEEEGKVKKREEKEEKKSYFQLSEGEKKKIDSIERSMEKLGYFSRIRYMYLAPREKYNPGPVHTAVVGAYKALGSSELNSLKPDTDRWTKVNYWLFKHLEAPIVEYRLKERKRRHMARIRSRNFLYGTRPFLLTTEEIATVLHFPGIEVVVPQIEKVPVRKVQPPPELPVVG